VGVSSRSVVRSISSPSKTGEGNRRPKGKEISMDRILALAPAEDHAQRALSLASELAQRQGAGLDVLRVLAESVRWRGSDPDGSREQQLRDLLLDSESRALEALCAPFQTDGREIRSEVAWGVPWDCILERVEREGFDLVVKPAHGLTHEGRVFFGSTALHLFRKCPCPVWVVGDDGRLPRRILAAIDPSIEARRLEAAARILDRARRVADRTDATVSIVAAWHAPASTMLKERMSVRELDEYVRDAHDQASSALDRILSECAPDLPRSRVHLIEGAAQDALPRFTEEHGTDLVVMGTLGRPGMTGDLLGETAEMIIRQVHSSILTVPPPVARPTRHDLQAKPA